MSQKFMAGLRGTHPNHRQEGIRRADRDLCRCNGATGILGNAQSLDEDI